MGRARWLLLAFMIGGCWHVSPIDDMTDTAGDASGDSDTDTDADADGDADADSDGDTDGDSDTATTALDTTDCASADYPITYNPINVLVLLDRSLSMSKNKIGSDTYAKVLADALKTVVQTNDQGDLINFGLAVFPAPACTNGDVDLRAARHGRRAELQPGRRPRGPERSLDQGDHLLRVHRRLGVHPRPIFQSAGRPRVQPCQSVRHTRSRRSDRCLVLGQLRGSRRVALER